MSYKIESRSKVKAEVSANRLRTFAYTPSLLNHISYEPNDITSHPEENPLSGVYTTIANVSVPTGKQSDFLTLFNQDLKNVMIIDRVYIQIISATVPLPDIDLQIFLFFAIPVGNPSILSTAIDNRSITNTPNVFSFTPILMGSYNVYPTLGDIIELINQNSDSLVCSFNQGISIRLLNLTAGDISAQAFVKFTITDIDEFD